MQLLIFAAVILFHIVFWGKTGHVGWGSLAIVFVLMFASYVRGQRDFIRYILPMRIGQQQLEKERQKQDGTDQIS